MQSAFFSILRQYGCKPGGAPSYRKYGKVIFLRHFDTGGQIFVENKQQ